MTTTGMLRLLRFHLTGDTALPVVILRSTGTIKGTWETFAAPRRIIMYRFSGLDRLRELIR